MKPSPLQELRTQLGRRKNLQAHIWQSAANYSQQVFGLAFGVILARLLQPDDFGQFALAVSIVTLVLLPTNWSLGQHIVADGGRTPELFSQANAFAWRLIGIRLLVVVGAGVWAFHAHGSTMLWLVILVGIPTAATELVAIHRAHLEGIGHFKANFSINMQQMILSVALGVPLALLHWGPYALAAPSPIFFAAQLWAYQRRSGQSIFSRKDGEFKLLNLLHKGFSLWLIGIGQSGLSRIDKIFVENFNGVDALGFYNRAFNYAPISHLALNSLVTNPMISSLARSETKSHRSQLIAKAGAVLLAGGTLNAAIWFFFSDPLVPLLFGEQWRGAIPIFIAFSGLSLAYSLHYLPVSVLLAAKSYTSLATIEILALAVFLAVIMTVPNAQSPSGVALTIQAILATSGIIMIARIATAKSS